MDRTVVWELVVYSSPVITLCVPCTPEYGMHEGHSSGGQILVSLSRGKKDRTLWWQSHLSGEHCQCAVCCLFWYGVFLSSFLKLIIFIKGRNSQTLLPPAAAGCQDVWQQWQPKILLILFFLPLPPVLAPSVVLTERFVGLCFGPNKGTDLP